MEKIESITKGITGFLRSFKKVVEDINSEKEIKKIVYTGNPYTCTPIIELLCYSIREMNKEIIYVPSLNIDNPYKVNLSDIDYNFSKGGDPLNPDLVVIMGGLAMRGGPDVENVQIFLDKIGNKQKKVIGFCFMSIFDKAGWCNVVPFDYLIDIQMDGSLYGR
ncbi:MAG: DUF2124 domain-containing protein [Candidatus Methanofastidiosum sp.]|nr:DUF2124 domain-containing protein [Methanofastidiosum sp.]